MPARPLARCRHRHGLRKQNKDTHNPFAGPNGVGRLVEMRDGSGSTKYEYDQAGRMTAKSQVITNRPFTTTYSHDSAGQLTAITYPSGMVVRYSYILGKVTGMTVNNTVVLSGIAYAPFGGATDWTFGNGQAYQRSVDLDGQLTAHTLGSDTRQLSHDSAGNITAIRDAFTNTQFGYDALNRLTSANDNVFNLSWDYDRNGNRLVQVSNGQSTAYAYVAGTNRLHSLDGAVYELVNHDANGNRIGDGRHTYQYDARDRLVSVDNGSAASYGYNGLGQRVTKQSANATRNFAYNESGQLIGEYDPLNTVNPQEFIWLNDLPVAVVQNDSIYYIHPDHLGTPRVITDQLGRTIWRWDSEPFGSTAANDDPDGDGQHFTFNLRFPGQYFDAETGLHYNYFRDYDPAVGGYTTSDPVGLRGGLNTYAYVNGNPLRLTDPFGLDFTCLGCHHSSQPPPPSSGPTTGPNLNENVIPFPGGRNSAGNGGSNGEGEQCNKTDPEQECREWKAQVLAYADNVATLELVTMRFNHNSRAIYQRMVNAYNNACGSITGYVPDTIFNPFDE